jgi:5,10-methylenetetrahydromethanopterin reductase
MELSAAFPPGPEVVEHARLAESLGYRRVWLYDSPALYPDVWATLARVAEATSRIGLGPAVLVPSLRHVLVTASAIASVEALAPGRLAVAVGTGFTGRALLGQRPMPWRRVEVWLRQLRALLRGETVEVDGARLRMLHPEGFAPPRPLATPILVAANGPRGLAVARELGDGVMCVAQPQPGFAWCALLGFGTVFEPGEDWRTPRVLDAIGPAIAVIYHGTWEQDPARLDHLPGGAAWRAEIERFPAAERHLAVHEDHLVAVPERDRRHLAPELGGTTISGPPQAVRERLEGLARAGCTELLYAPLGSDVPRELRAMAEAAGVGGAPR